MSKFRFIYFVENTGSFKNCPVCSYKVGGIKSRPHSNAEYGQMIYILCDKCEFKISITKFWDKFPTNEQEITFLREFKKIWNDEFIR